MNKYTEFTRKGLEEAWTGDKNLLKYNEDGFTLYEDDIKSEECVLVIGINPAGGEQEAERSTKGLLYLFSTDYGIQLKSHGNIELAVNNGYFRPIKSFVNGTLDNKRSRWMWSKQDWSIIEDKIDRDDVLRDSKEEIRKQYLMDQTREVTIYYGDLFYAHMTKLSDFQDNIDEDKIRKSGYCKTMLEMHVEDLKKHNKVIKYVYINNGWASSLIEKNNKQKYIILKDGTFVCLGGQTKWLQDKSWEEYTNLIKEHTK